MAGPVAPANQAEIFYNYAGRGFTEHFWIVAGADRFAAADAIITNYLPQRMSIADNDLQAMYIRISDYPATRVVGIKDLTTLGINGQISGDGSAPDDVIFCRLQGNSVATPSTLCLGFLHLHAFPANLVSQQFLIASRGGYAAKLQNFLSSLGSPSSPIRLRGKVPNTPAQRVGITAATPVPPRGARLTLASVAGLNAGDVVRISGAGSAEVGYNGLKVIQFPPDVPNLQIVVGGAQPVGVIASGAYLVKQQYDQATVQRADALRLSERKTGRPFELPPGRKHNVLSLRR